MSLAKIGNKIFKKEVKLSKEQIELTMLGDIAKMYKESNQMAAAVNQDVRDVKEAIRAVGFAKVNVKNTESWAKELESRIIKMEGALKDLGIDIPEQVFEAGKAHTRIEKANNELKSLLKKI